MRTAARVLQWLLPLLGWESRAPTYYTLRLWLLRVGLHQLQQLPELADDWVWIADHTQQLGDKKVFLVVGLRLEAWLAQEPLQPEEMQLLALEPVTTSTGEVICEQFTRLTERTGLPRVIVSDDGADLRRGIRLFREQHPQVAWVYDIKHCAAILLKRELEKDERWSAFTAAVNRTKQQCSVTKLAALLPPQQRGKSRYLNVQELMAWATKVLTLLDQPPALAAADLDPTACEQRFGWLRDYRASVQEWQAGMRVIELVESHVRRQGVYRGVAEHLHPQLEEVVLGSLSRHLAHDLVTHLREQSLQADADEHLPASSEILESLIGKYKYLQGEQAQHGLTSLVLGLGTLLAHNLADLLPKALAEVSADDLFQWCRESLGTTLQASRQRLSRVLLGTKTTPAQRAA